MPEYMFSRAVFLTSFTWALTIHFADSINNKNEGYILRFGIVLMAHIILFGFWWVMKITLLDFLKPSWVPILLLFVIIIGSGLRGLVFQYLLEYFEFSVDITYLQRSLASILNITLITTLATVAVANLQAHQSLRIRLLIEADRLEFAKRTSRLTFEEVGLENSQQIKKDLLFKLSVMRKSTPPQMLIQIQSMIDEVVRPLSRSLDESNPSWVPPQFDNRAHRIGFKSAFNESAKPSQISFLFVPVFMYIFSVPSIFERTSFFTAFVVFPSAILVAVIFSFLIVQFVAPRWNSRFAYFFLTILNGAFLGLSTFFYTPDFENPLALFASALLFYITWSFIVSFLKTLFRLNSEANQELDEFANELAWQVAQLRQISFQSRRRLAATLHGQVQAKLASTYLQLEKLPHIESEAKEKVDSLLCELERTIEGIDSNDTESHALDVMIQKVIDNWAKIAQIQLVASEKIISKIQMDHVCTAALAALIPELCFNSIKHGKASYISIDLAFKSDRVLELIVSNDGISSGANPTTGLGSKLLNEISIFWDRKTENARAVTRVELAYRATH